MVLALLPFPSLEMIMKCSFCTRHTTHQLTSILPSPPVPSDHQLNSAKSFTMPTTIFNSYLPTTITISHVQLSMVLTSFVSKFIIFIIHIQVSSLQSLSPSPHPNQNPSQLPAPHSSINTNLPPFSRFPLPTSSYQEQLFSRLYFTSTTAIVHYLSFKSWLTKGTSPALACPASLLPYQVAVPYVMQPE